MERGSCEGEFSLWPLQIGSVRAETNQLCLKETGCSPAVLSGFRTQIHMDSVGLSLLPACFRLVSCELGPQKHYIAAETLQTGACHLVHEHVMGKGMQRCRLEAKGRGRSLLDG